VVEMATKRSLESFLGVSANQITILQFLAVDEAPKRRRLAPWSIDFIVDYETEEASVEGVDALESLSDEAESFLSILADKGLVVEGVAVGEIKVTKEEGDLDFTSGTTKSSFSTTALAVLIAGLAFMLNQDA